MNKSEAIKLLALYEAAYPASELTDFQMQIWSEELQPIPFEIGIRNMREHIRTSKFPPSIAEIIDVGQHHKIDPEILARNRDIAQQNWVREGGDPADWSYQLMMPKRSLTEK